MLLRGVCITLCHLLLLLLTCNYILGRRPVFLFEFHLLLLLWIEVMLLNYMSILCGSNTGIHSYRDLFGVIWLLHHSRIGSYISQWSSLSTVTLGIDVHIFIQLVSFLAVMLVVLSELLLLARFSRMHILSDWGAFLLMRLINSGWRFRVMIVCWSVQRSSCISLIYCLLLCSSIVLLRFFIILRLFMREWLSSSHSRWLDNLLSTR